MSPKQDQPSQRADDPELAELRNQVIPWERNFRERMAALREALGMTQTDLARRLSVWGLPFHQQTIQRIEAGERPVRLNEAHLIAKSLESTVEVMVANVELPDRPLAIAVDRLRAAAAEFDSSLSDLAAEWDEDMGDLALLLYEARPTLDAGESLSEIAYWAFAWLKIGVDVAQALHGASYSLRHLATGVEPDYDEVGKFPNHFSAQDIFEEFWASLDWVESGRGTLPRTPPQSDWKAEDARNTPIEMQVLASRTLTLAKALDRLKADGHAILSDLVAYRQARKGDSSDDADLIPEARLRALVKAIPQEALDELTAHLLNRKVQPE